MDPHIIKRKETNQEYRSRIGMKYLQVYPYFSLIASWVSLPKVGINLILFIAIAMNDSVAIRSSSLTKITH